MMYEGQSGYQYYPPTAHDEPYNAASYYPPFGYDARPPQPVPQGMTPNSAYYYSPQPQTSTFHTPHVSPQPMAPAISRDHPSMRAPPAVPPALAVDPAFSNDPRANPYSHYTTFAMDSREEIVPIGPNHDSFYVPQHPNDTPNRSRELRALSPSNRDISSIYGPPIVPERHASASRPVSDASHHARSPYIAAPSMRDPRASTAFGDVRPMYGVPNSYPAVIPIPPPGMPSAKTAKLHKPRNNAPKQQDTRQHSAASLYPASVAPSSPASSSSSSFVHVPAINSKSSASLVSSAKSKSSLHVVNETSNADTTGPYAVFRPTPDSPSASSASSSEGPVTPPQLTPEKMSVSSSHSSKNSKHSHARSHSHSPKKDLPLSLDTAKVSEILTASVTQDSPPAYTPLPITTDLLHDSSKDANPDASFPLPQNDVSISSSAAVGLSEQPSAQPSEPQVPQPRGSPPRDAAVPLAFPSASQTSSMPPIQAPSEMRKSRSRKTSIAAPSKDLDKIDELDETDPLGFAWHHHGPYEAIAKKAAAEAGQNGTGHKESRGAKIFSAQGGADTSMSSTDSKKSHRKPPPLDPSVTSFKVKPGQIFPPVLPPQAVALPPTVAPTPMSPQAPMSPLQKQSFMNAHMLPVGKYDPVPPPFSPTPSQMERARNPEHRMSIMSQVINAEPATYYAPSYSNSRRPPHSHAGSQTSHQSHSSVPSSSSASSSSRSVRRVPPPQAPSNVQEPHVTHHRPHPQPVQPMPPQDQSQANLARSHSTPNPRLASLPSQPISQQPASAPFLLSADPPPTPDIRLPPPSVRTRSTHPPSINGQQQPPRQPHYLPKRLVMPTPLQPLQPLPQQQAASVSGSNSRPPPSRSYGENSATRMKRGATTGGNPAPQMKAQAQEIPISAGRNLLKKQKEHKVMDKELEKEVRQIEMWEKERERESERARERERQQRGMEREAQKEAPRAKSRTRSASMSIPPSHTANAAVFTSKVVVPVQVTPSKSNGGGWGFGALFSSAGDKAREKEREKGKKLSKRRQP